MFRISLYISSALLFLHITYFNATHTFYDVKILYKFLAWECGFWVGGGVVRLYLCFFFLHRQYVIYIFILFKFFVQLVYLRKWYVWNILLYLLKKKKKTLQALNIHNILERIHLKPIIRIFFSLKRITRIRV